MRLTFPRRTVAVAALLATAACTVHDSSPPALSGPSGLALTLTVNAIPDAISQDGGSQSSIKVTAVGPDGQPVVSLPLRMDMFVGGAAGDYGTLSARTIVTNSSGVATVTYTAPPRPANGVFGTCNSLPGNCVSIVATPTSTNFSTVNSEAVLIRLVPPGVILPPTQSPAANFSFSPGSPAANSPVQFDASSSCGGPLNGAACPNTSPSITQYSWNFGDGQTATGRTASHSFALQQTYTVTLTITNDLGNSGVRSQSVTVGSGSLPSATFTFSPAQPRVGDLVFFSGQSSTAGQGHAIASYRWTFGDGATGSGATVSHAYAAAGTYTAQLTVTDESGQATTSSGVTVPVAAPGGPTANFTFSPATPSVGDSVLFDWRTSTVAAGQTIVSLDWNFGDGTAAAHCPGDGACAPDGITTHAFQRAGVFTVALVVTDSAGRTGIKSAAVTVASGGGGGNGTTVAKFTFSPTTPNATQPVFFNASLSTASAGHSIVGYAWDFGDGTTDSGVSVAHSFIAAGTFTVTLTVTEDGGQKGITSSSVTVTPIGSGSLVAGFTASPTNPISGALVAFNANTSSPLSSITQFDWDFGDGTVVNNGGMIINHTYNTPADANFTIRLTVHDTAGRTATATQGLTVKAGLDPTAAFRITTGNPATVGVAVNFDPSASTAGAGVITDYQWNFGDGSAIVSANPGTHTYAATGTYTIVLTVTQTNGRTNSTSHTLLVQ